MVYHVGIDPFEGFFSAYDTRNKTYFCESIAQILFQVPSGKTSIATMKSNFCKIDKMFKEIKTKLKGELGCACVYLSPKNYPIRFRQHVSNAGFLHGFQKVQIIDFDATLIYSMISQSPHLSYPNNFTLIHTIGKKIYIWTTENQIVNFIADIIFDASTFATHVVPSFGKHPDIFLYNHNLELQQYFTETFPHFTYCCYNWGQWSQGALYKARMMGSDHEVMFFDVQSNYGTSVVVRVNDIEIMRAEYGELLPLTKKVEYSLLNVDNFLTIVTGAGEQVACLLPQLEKVLFVLQIKTDKTYSIKYMEIPNDGSNVWEKIIMSHHAIELFNIEESSKLIYRLPRIVNNSKINAIGIDLGTSRCCAAVNRKSGIETVALDNEGQRQLPSYVAFDEEKAKCGQLVINRLQHHAKSTVFDAKRIIGKNYGEVNIDKSWSFEMETFHLIDPKRQRRTKWIPGEEVLIKLQISNGITLKRPEEISAVLLKHIKNKVEEFQGKQLTEAVITVPAAFNKSQKQTTYDAALLAGWKSVHLLPEPVAAAFAYFVNRTLLNNSTFLLFDLGGGTMDVCIFEVNKNTLKFISRNGDPNIGGRDFDNLLIKHFEEILKNEHNVRITESKKYKLLLKCQSIKENLSTIEDDFLDAEEIDSSIDGNIFITVTRNEFEAMSAALLQQIRKNIIAALEKIDFKPHQIKQVLQVGGGCRMPMIKKLLKEIFPDSEHICEQNPDEVVAIGAAYYSYYLHQKDKSSCSVM